MATTLQESAGSANDSQVRGDMTTIAAGVYADQGTGTNVCADTVVAELLVVCALV